MRPIALLLASPFGLAACALPAPPPSAPPPEVISGSSEISPDAVAAGKLDRFVGNYRNGADTLIIARLGQQLAVDVPGPQGPEPLKMVGLATFIDASGTTYFFILSPDGPGAMLQTQRAGSALRTWQRFP